MFNHLVIGYIRVSTEDQAKNGFSLGVQRRKIVDYCKLYELQLVHVYHDASSGGSLGRPGLQNALEHLGVGGVTGLITPKLDRLTRSVKDMGVLIDKHFKKHSLIVVAENIDTQTASGKLVVNVLMSVAQWEREVISERTREVLQSKRQRAEPTGKIPPYGFTKFRKKLLRNEDEVDLLKKIVRCRKDGLSWAETASSLNDDGKLNRLGKPWSRQRVHDLIKRLHPTLRKEVMQSVNVS